MLTVYNPKRRLAQSTQQVTTTIELVWSAYRSILSKEGGLAYVSVAITTGLRLYKLLSEMGLSSVDELRTKHPDIFYDQILRTNLDFAGGVSRTIAQSCEFPVVAPCIFEARKQRWTQDEYMAMWLAMIEENVKRMYMSPGWEFSNGGVEEYLHAVLIAYGYRKRHDMDILDASGKPLTLDKGLRSMADALVQLHDLKQKAPVVANAFRTLIGIAYLERSLDSYDMIPVERNHAFTEGASHRDIVRAGCDIGKLLKEDYGFDLWISVAFDQDLGNVVHKTEALPESVVLTEVQPDAPAAQPADDSGKTA